MEWIERLNRAINCIEEHLTDTIDYDELGRISGCSSYHFQRMFAYMADVPLSEYIRRRKMSLAAVDLLSTDAKVIDLALKYGYNSPTAFNRAFKMIHGIAPSAVRTGGITVKSFPPISFKMTIKGVEQMNYRIEKKESFRIVGVSVALEKELEKNFEKVPKLWQTCHMDGTIKQLEGMINTDIKGVLGVSSCNDEKDWRYYIAVASTLTSDEYEAVEVPAATWAIFQGEGTGISIQELEKRIVTDWLPTSGYEYANAPDVEVYLSSDPKNMKYEVWIPVTKKL